MNKWLKRLGVFLAALLLVAVSTFMVGVAWPVATLEPPRTEGPLAFVDVAVVDVAAGAVRTGQTVIVRGTQIEAVGDAAELAVPDQARRIDGAGRFLMPALWDMHTHVLAVTPLLNLPQYLAFGVTNVRDLNGCPQRGDPFVACAEDKQRWTDEALAGSRVGPRIISSASYLANGPRTLQRRPGLPAHFATSTPDEARAFVESQAGAQEIKVYDRLPREAFLHLSAAARAAGKPLVGHRPHGVSAIEAAVHMKSMDHARFLLHESFDGSDALREAADTPEWREDRRLMVDRHDPARAQAIFETMRREGTWYVPTHLTRWADAGADAPEVREDPALRLAHPLMRRLLLEDLDATVAQDPTPAGRQAYRDFYRKGLALTGEAHRAGVRILVGTDYFAPGLDVHRELEQLVLAGLSPAEALRAATIGPAEYFGRLDAYGAVAEGLTADLLLLSANPLEDVRHAQRIEAVVFNGTLYDAEDITRVHAWIEGQAGSWTAAAKIIWSFVVSPVSY